MRTLTVSISPRSAQSYPVVIGAGAIQKMGEYVPKDADGVVVICDSAMAAVAKDAAKRVKAKGVIEVKSGEASKTLKETERIAAELLKLRASRKTVLICIGGGMLTDLGGFVASVYMRGIRHIAVPTTLLGMVDASVGGKTGVDLGSAKNIIGTIHHPLAIICDIDLLKTLPDPALRDGLTESIKMAAILDAKIFHWFEKALPKILKRDETLLTECVEHSVRMKADVVAGDERESGQRMFLNFGHTVGHAVEALSQFHISHGRAVSIGMVAEMRLAKTRETDRIVALLKQMDMPIEIPADQAMEALWSLMQSDKKNAGGEVRMAVPEPLGTGAIKTISKPDFLSLRR